MFVQCSVHPAVALAGDYGATNLWLGYDGVAATVSQATGAEAADSDFTIDGGLVPTWQAQVSPEILGQRGSRSAGTVGAGR
jgi:hypothetical protein